MEHTKGLQLHDIAMWDARHLPTIRSLVWNRELGIRMEILWLGYLGTTQISVVNFTWKFYFVKGAELSVLRVII